MRDIVLCVDPEAEGLRNASLLDDAIFLFNYCFYYFFGGGWGRVWSSKTTAMQGGVCGVAVFINVINITTR